MTLPRRSIQALPGAQYIRNWGYTGQQGFGLPHIHPTPLRARSAGGRALPDPGLSGARGEGAVGVRAADSALEQAQVRRQGVCEDDCPPRGRCQTTSAHSGACKLPRKNTVSSVISNEGEAVDEAGKKKKEKTLPPQLYPDHPGGSRRPLSPPDPLARSSAERPC